MIVANIFFILFYFYCDKMNALADDSLQSHCHIFQVLILPLSSPVCGQAQTPQACRPQFLHQKSICLTEEAGGLAVSINAEHLDSSSLVANDP